MTYAQCRRAEILGNRQRKPRRDGLLARELDAMRAEGERLSAVRKAAANRLARAMGI